MIGIMDAVAIWIGYAVLAIIFFTPFSYAFMWALRRFPISEKTVEAETNLGKANRKIWVLWRNYSDARSAARSMFVIMCLALCLAIYFWTTG